MVELTNLLVQSNNVNHGSAYYMLTGTDDYEYLLDTMVKKQQIKSTDVSTYLNKSDGYRLRYIMVGMKTALVTKNDTEAICLYSPKADGALCAGL